MMNKKGDLQTFLTKGFVVAIALIIFYVALGGVFVSAGGIGAVFNLSKIIVNVTKFMAQIPIWVWVGLAFLWIITQLRR